MSKLPSFDITNASMPLWKNLVGRLYANSRTIYEMESSARVHTVYEFDSCYALMEKKNMNTTLLIMAAGIGIRFGNGIKQLEPVDDADHIIMDYSIHGGSCSSDILSLGRCDKRYVKYL